VRQEVRERMAHDGRRGGPVRGSLGDRFAAQLGMDPRVLSFAIARQDASISEPEPGADGHEHQLLPDAQVENPTSHSQIPPLEQVQTLVEVKPEQGKQGREGIDRVPARGTPTASSAERPYISGYHTAYTGVRQ